ncbi:MAG: hypothetical protein KF685_04240 [Acidobacteria bacterium]|nr:hypothetical protein [Acidobacteriota bacterium]
MFWRFAAKLTELSGISCGLPLCCAAKLVSPGACPNTSGLARDHQITFVLSVRRPSAERNFLFFVCGKASFSAQHSGKPRREEGIGILKSGKPRREEGIGILKSGKPRRQTSRHLLTQAVQTRARHRQLLTQAVHSE